MSSNNELAEALARVEHKVDVMLTLMIALAPATLVSSVVKQLNDPEHHCPVCIQPVKYQMDYTKKVLVRVCGCKTGLQAPVDFRAYEPPKVAGGTHGGSSKDGNSEGWNDPRGG